MLLVGPDGTGKSTTAALLAASETSGVHTIDHYRPGILWQRGNVPTTTPHDEPARSVPAATAKLAAVFADFLLGYLGPWRRAGRTGVIVLERGWWDHLADPVRYRLPHSLCWFAALLARLLPRADLVVVLAGDPASIVRRKPELSVGQVEAQLLRWKEIAPRAGRRVITVDTVAATPVQVAATIEAAVNEPPARWIAVPLTPSRNRVVAMGGSDGVAALTVYRPNSRRSQLIAPLRSLLVRLGWGRRVRDPDPVLSALPGLAGIGGSPSMAAMVSTGRDRLVVGLATGGQLVAVAKVGSLDDEGLRNEAAVVTRLQDIVSPVRSPTVRFAELVDDRFVLVSDAAHHTGGPVERDEIDPLLSDLADIGLVHGDLAPWNLVRESGGRLVVLDLEHARWGSDVGFDLCHFLVQCGALLGVGSPDDVLDDLDRSTGLDAAPIVRHYCDVRRARDDASDDERRFMKELERAVSVRDDDSKRSNGDD